MKYLALLFIVIYRRFISPYKGFSCAYRVHKGGAACSSYAYEAIERKGFWVGLALIQRRFNECALEHRKAGERFSKIRTARLSHQSGHCDLPVGDCDFGHLPDACDLAQGCDASACDFDGWRRKKDDSEKE